MKKSNVERDKKEKDAKALKTEAYIRVGIGNYWGALESFAKVIKIYLVLTNIDPTYRPELAKIFNDSANVLHELSRFTDARDTYEDALEIYRDLSTEEPKTYDPNISKTLNNLANVLVDLRDYVPARTFYEECLILKNQLVNLDPKTYLPELALALGNFGTMLRAVREFSSAQKNHEEALTIFRELSESDPETYRKDIARTLNSLGVVHSAQHNDELSKQAYKEALSIQRELSLDDPKTYRPQVSLTLTNLGNTLFDLRDFPSAQKSFEEALSIRRDLAKIDPTKYRSKVAKSLDGLGYVLYAQDQFFLARKAYEEAIEIYRELAKGEPDAYLPNITKTLDDLARLLVDTGYSTKSQKAFEEAIYLAETQLHDGSFQHLTKMKIHAAYRALLKSSIQNKDDIKAFVYTAALRDGQSRSYEINEQDLHQTQSILKQKNLNTGVDHQIVAPTLGLDGELLVGLISSDRTIFYAVETNAWDKLSPSEEPGCEKNEQRYQLARQLWEVLPNEVQHVLTSSADSTNILISADPFWSAFPWELLRFGEGKQDYLGLHHVLPRIGAIHASKLEILFSITISSSEGTVAIFAPYDTDPSDPLLGTIVETNTIKSVVNEHNPSKLLAFAQGQKADDQEIKRQFGLQPDIFYYSGHGTIKDNEEYLKLHSSKGEDSVTYFGRQELRDLSRGAKDQGLLSHHPLIVLNSCVTGRSQTTGGERQDLVAAFLELGARTVIASPISIQDMVGKAFGEILFHQLMDFDTSIGNIILKVRQELARDICSNVGSPYWGTWAMIHLHGNSTI